MSGLLPEKPILLYPSLAARYGTDEAILLAIYHEVAQHHGGINAQQETYCILRRSEWAALVDFWDEDRLAAVTSSLVDQGALRAAFNANGSLTISWGAQPAAQPASAIRSEAASVARPETDLADAVDKAPGHASARGLSLPKESDETPEEPVSERRSVASIETSDAAQPAILPNPAARSAAGRAYIRSERQPSPQYNGGSPLAQRGPAPTFGGSTGWSKSHDELEAIFAQREAHNQRMHEMYPDWKPAATTYDMLRKQQIPAAFAEQRIDEFIAYWLERDRREVSWDHQFLKLVKREWVREQGREARVARQQQESNTGIGHENAKTNPREHRKRVSAAILNLQDTDW